MADIRHSTLTGADLHNPKQHALESDTLHINGGSAGEVLIAAGDTTADWGPLPITSIDNAGTDGQIVCSDGAGGLKLLSTPHGALSFTDLTVPPTVYSVALSVGAGNTVKLAPTAVAGGSPTEMTESNTARLTYTGTTTRHFHIAASISFDQNSGAPRNIVVEIWKNGVGTGTLLPGGMLMTTSTGTLVSTAIHADTMLAENDYIELAAYTIASTATLRLASFYLFAMGMTES